MNNKLKSELLKNNRIPRMFTLMLGAFISALVYNSFIVPNNIVSGGGGGLAIIVNKLTGMNTTLFLNIFIIISTIIAIFFLGKKKILYSVTGYIAYYIMLNITAPISKYINLQFDSYLFSICLFGIISGIGSSFIYRAGFNTGGIETYVEILQDKLKIPFNVASNILNGIIIVLGAIFFGPINTIYTLIYLIVSNYACEYIQLGNSSNKLCYIDIKNKRELERYLTNEIGVSFNYIESTNGIGIFKHDIIMCVIPTDMYYNLKRKVKEIDSNATIYSEDCYTVYGGQLNSLLPV